jgi:spore coat polysaccharide biosynthesis protein SpsF
LYGTTVLGELIARVQSARFTQKVVVATTTESWDDVIVRLCREAGVAFFRGHPHDLLDRHYRALQSFPADAVVKIPSDCPLVDPRVIDKVLGFFVDHPGRYDYVSNLHPQSYPDGNDVEIMTAEALAVAYREARRAIDREHTTPFLWDQPHRFRLGNLSWERGHDYSLTHRWTLDYWEDYQFIRAVHAELHSRERFFGVDEILELLQARPTLRRINERHLGDMWYFRQGGAPSHA